jgi:hypothetical protein
MLLRLFGRFSRASRPCFGHVMEATVLHLRRSDKHHSVTGILHEPQLNAD